MRYLDKLKNNQGTVTIYLVIIFMALLLFIGLLIDVARIKIAQNKLRGAANASARSVLAEYNSSLRKGYGLFAASPSNYQQDFAKYIHLNLSVSKGQTFQLLNMKVEDSQIYMARPLTDTKVFKQQILEDMKYRGPIEVIKQLVAKFTAVKRVVQAGNNEIKKGQEQKALNGQVKQLKNKNSELKNQKHRVQALNNELKELNSTLKSKEAELNREKNPQKAAVLTQEIKQLKQTKLQKELELKNSLQAMEDILQEAQELRTQMQQSLEKMEKFQTQQKEEAQQPLEKNEDPQVQAQLNKNNSIEEKQITKLKEDLQKLDANLQISKKALLSYINGNNESNDYNENELLNQVNLDMADTIYNSQTNNPPDESANLEKNKLRGEMAKYQKKFNQVYQGKSIPFTTIEDSSVNPFEKDAKDQLAQDNTNLLEKLLQVIDLENLFNNARDKILINEYALTYFSYLTGSPKGGELYPYQKSEVEYFLYGGKYPEIQAMAALFKLRFALNTVGHLVYSPIPDPLVRIVESLIMGSLTAVVDTYKLLTGEEVPIITIYPNNPFDKAGLKLNYLDHLRVFLLLDTQSEEARLQKLIKLINLRNGQEVTNAATLIDGRVDVSIKMWFLPLAGLKEMSGPFGTKIRNGRCFISKDVEYSY